jgi:hypothetical protein
MVGPWLVVVPGIGSKRRHHGFQVVHVLGAYVLLDHSETCITILRSYC